MKNYLIVATLQTSAPWKGSKTSGRNDGKRMMGRMMAFT